MNHTERPTFQVAFCTESIIFLKGYKKLNSLFVNRKKCCCSCLNSSSPRQTLQVYATSRKAGGAQLLEKKKQKRVKSESKTQGDPGKPYKVLLFNDETHTK